MIKELKTAVEKEWIKKEEMKLNNKIEGTIVTGRVRAWKDIRRKKERRKERYIDKFED